MSYVKSNQGGQMFILSPLFSFVSSQYLYAIGNSHFLCHRKKYLQILSFSSKRRARLRHITVWNFQFFESSVRGFF